MHSVFSPYSLFSTLEKKAEKGRASVEGKEILPALAFTLSFLA